ncbi:MAG: ChbG/HpnK family deacetylase [Chloroflexi bacterium]|nr:ChbG/HpnK family deacetylase [Chloroflexota bacterium]
MPTLRIVGDDIGLSPRQNDHVVALAREGLLTGVSILTNFPHAESVCQQLHALGIEDIGVHLNLSDGFPLTPLPRGGALVHRSGRFRDRRWLMWRGLRLHQRLRTQISEELAAQIERIHRWGARPAHLDSHCHFHTIPAFTRLVQELALQFEIPRIRAPHLRANLAPLSPSLLPQRIRGVEWAGQRQSLVLAEQWLQEAPFHLISMMAQCQGEVELVVHPGCTPDEAFPHRFRYSPEMRARESEFLRRFWISFRAESRGIELAK